MTAIWATELVKKLISALPLSMELFWDFEWELKLSATPRVFIEAARWQQGRRCGYLVVTFAVHLHEKCRSRDSEIPSYLLQKQPWG